MAKRLGELVTRVAGAMSGPEATLRQAGLEEVRRLVKEGKYVPLLLVPEPTNPFDGDAVRCEVELPGLGRIQVGYVKNSTGVCDLCHKPFSRYPKICSGCRHSDHLRRDGAATQISAALRDCPSLKLIGEITEVTGGQEDKPSFGCNIRVTPLYPDELVTSRA